MSMDKLQNALGDVQDEFILDAHAGTVAKRYGWVKWAAAAACVVIAVLIAVPALWGKAPKVDPNPVEVIKPEPTDEPEVEPVDEPVVEPVDEPVPNEPESETISISQSTGKSLIPIEFHILDTDEPMEISSRAGGQAGSVAGGDNTPEMYLAWYTSVKANPVFAKLFATQEIRDTYQIRDIEYSDERDWKLEAVIFTTKGAGIWLTTAESHRQVYVEHIVYYTDSHYENTGFAKAEELGVRADFIVDGITVEKYDGNDLPAVPGLENIEAYHYERIYYDGSWYELRSYSEEDLDFVASAMAHAISTL